MSCADAPNFFVIGGAKCGTTTLYHLLRQVDDVYLPKSKEPRFFGNIDAYRRGLRFYLDEHFDGAAPFPARGEATPNYLHGRGVVAERIRDSLGDDLRFVVLLRDPVRRAWSHYLHMRRLGKEDLPFDAALEAEPERLAADPESWFGYFSDGLYAAQLQEWFAVFPPERFLILLTDTLTRDPRGAVDAVCDFLGVARPAALELAVENNAAGSARSRIVARLLNRPNAVTNVLKLAVPFPVRQRVRDRINAWNRIRREAAAPQLPAAIERRLREGYADDVTALETITGFELSAWRRPEPAGERRQRAKRSGRHGDDARAIPPASRAHE